MSIARGSNPLPQLPPGAMDVGRELGYTVIVVHLDDPKEPDGQSNVRMYAFAQYLPRAGDILMLTNGSACEVQRVMHQVTMVDVNGQKMPLLNPGVLARLVHEPGPTAR